jgi:Domain of unknown function (DUF6265)
MTGNARSCLFSALFPAAAAVAAFSLLAAAPASAQPRKHTIDDLAFLAGCWEGEIGDGSVIRETYTAPRGGTMLGNSQVAAGGKTLFFEFIQLAQTDAGVAYKPSPNAKDSVAFPLAKLEGTSVVFENAAHDFPQRISYVLDGGKLTARIEKLDGQKAQSFAMKATPCGAEAHRKALSK